MTSPGAGARRLALGRSKAERIGQWGSVVAIVAGLLSLLVVLFEGFGAEAPRVPATAIGFADDLEQQIGSLRRELDAVRGQVEGLDSVADDSAVDDSAVAAQLRGFEGTLSAMNDRLTSMEEAILADPARALQVPLLSNQVENLEEKLDESYLNQEKGLDRLEGLFQITFVALAVGVVGSGIRGLGRG